MPAADKLLSSIFRSSRKLPAVKRTTKLTSCAVANDDDTLLTRFVSAIDSAAASPPVSRSTVKPPSSLNPPKVAICPAKEEEEEEDDTDPFIELGEERVPDPYPDTCQVSGDTMNQQPTELESMLDADGSDGLPEFMVPNNGNILDQLGMPWLSIKSNNDAAIRRKGNSHERKQKWVLCNSESRRFNRIVKSCSNCLGTETTFEIFGRLGKENGVKQHNSLIGICVEKARACDDEEVAVEQICRAFQIFNSMKEKQFQIEEKAYGPLLMYFIDKGMIEEFHFISNTINNGIPSSVPRLGYYEMLLWSRVNDEQKIRELCKHAADDDEGNYFSFRENYLLALSESDRKDELLELLDTIDISKISSLDNAAFIFKSLGRLLLESYAEKYLLAVKESDDGANNVSSLVVSYITGIPNLEVDDIFLKFKDMHAKLEIKPSSASCKKLITYYCGLHKVHVALDVVDHMFECGLVPSVVTINSILLACEQSNEFNLVRRIYSMICNHNLKSNRDTFRSMINLSARMKDFDGAYSLLSELKEMNLNQTTCMYNAIMAGYFGKKDIQGALTVFKQMEQADVKPDSQTFSYLIQSCSNEEDVKKYYGQLKSAGVTITKQVVIALINAYATCGEFEKAKQVALDSKIAIKSRSEIKSALVAALASHGRTSDAIILYEEIKQAGSKLEPRAVIALIDHVSSQGELHKLVQALDEVHDPDCWSDGCCRLILHCVRLKHLSSAMDLLKKLNDKLKNEEMDLENLMAEIFCQIAEADPPDVEIGMYLLQYLTSELGLPPSRKCLDFLLSACVSARDLQRARLVWNEYQKASLPYNVLSYLWMYKAFLASNDHRAAGKLLSKIPKDDPHVRSVIKKWKQKYVKSVPAKGKKDEEMTH